ncbi:hypothetical protein RHGRI_009175 [Rhododendron griersonianum]|uniref:BHLH domain-containing protein n=1 Tax=Rhododendron griersonianum TaxID=479676 RepID=A0AAV6L4F6_9ERIC|nr:hypothetical protein RHGRI_009175 [Rhododendron griersonianum]
MSLQTIQHHHHQQQQIDTSNNQIQHFDPATPSHDDFLDQMLSTLPSCSWPPDLAGTNPKSPWDLSASTPDDQFHFDHDQSAILAAKLRQHQINGDGGSSPAAKSLLLQQQLLFQSRGGISGGESCLMPLSLVQALYNGFSTGQHFHHVQGGAMQAQNYGVAAAVGVVNQTPAGGGGVGQPRQRVRARRGQATDPHSIAERLRRERIAERMKALQELVPNANKTDKASMLDEIIDYVKFLQLQVKVLSMSRLGGAAAVAPLVADMSSEGGGDCTALTAGGKTTNGTQAASASTNNETTMTVTEHQVAKLMEEDMGSAMQYLQGKGLCLMPISLANAISTATCHSRNPMIPNNHHPLLGSNGVGGNDGFGGPSSPSISALTVSSAAMGNGGGADGSVKDAASVSKP